MAIEETNAPPAPIELVSASNEIAAVTSTPIPLVSSSLSNYAQSDQSNHPKQEDAVPVTDPAKTRKENAYQVAPWWSKLSFQWAYELLKIGLERPLDDSDLYQVMSVDTSTFNLQYFHKLWQKEQELHPSHPSLHRALLKDFFATLWFVQIYFVAGYTARILQAVVLGWLIDYFQGHNDRGYLWAGLLVVCGAIILFEHHHVFFLTWRKGMQYRIASVAAIFQKALRLSSTYQDASGTGRIMNLASNDVERYLLTTLFITFIFWAPVQAVAILVVGCYLLGPAFAAGFALLVVVFVPIQFYWSNRFAHFRSRTAALTDQRVSFVSQAIRGARVMKMSGYEWRFLQRMEHYRQAEVAQIRKANKLKAWNESLFYCTNFVITVTIFMVHVWTGHTLRTGDVFTVFTLINILQLEMSKHGSLGVMATSECSVSVSRIQRFLEYPEIPDFDQLAVPASIGVAVNANTELGEAEVGSNANFPIRREERDNELNDIVIAFENVKCYWNDVKPVCLRSKQVATGQRELTTCKQQNAFPKPHSPINEDEEASTDDSVHSSLFLALDHVTVDFRVGTLTAVLGTVGSGKSALLQALVRELPIASGIVKRQYETLSYAAQDPWIMDGTVRENIVFGNDWNEEWYNTVVTSCGLVLDFQHLRLGDRTTVGDRGIQCSGGQRARIGLARALYRDADVLIADDPLSAVDAKVGRHIFSEALMSLAVNRGKCVVLATHQHQYVHDCRCILVEDGRVTCIGSYEECVEASKGKLTAHAADDAIDALGDDEEEAREVQGSNEYLGINNDQRDGTSDEKNEDKLAAQVNEHKEMNIQGLVRLDTYIKYFKAMGGVWIAYALFLLFSLTQTSVLVTITTLGRWAARPAQLQNDWDIMGWVLGLVGCAVILSLFRTYICFHLAIKASQRLHDRMALAVLRAKIEFFDTNPLGRILNRFSADVGSNDDLLPQTLYDFTAIAFVVLGAVATTVTTLPFTIVALPPLMWYFYSVRRTFVTSTRELKRLEGMARSPIFAMLGEALGGIATIRANNALPYFSRKFEEAHDTHTRAFFAFIAASRWVGFRMDAIVFLFMSAVSFLSVLSQDFGWFAVDPSILGLSLAFLLQLAGLFQWCIRQSAEVVNMMVSVERVLAFGDVESEAPLVKDVDASLQKQGWPDKGAIELDNVSVRYRQSLPLALRGVSVIIPAGSRVGIVGRTGSGKSTIVQTLFRLLEAEEGRIVLDGVDISTVGLHALRTKLSVIPQVPTLFSGCTVRENLDLFGLHSDDEIREVLMACHLYGTIMEDLPLGWNSPVAEGGNNFSVGQRQLLCLARAILNQAHVLVLDEATASVDRRTDQLLQEALQKSFRHGTILAVAHRLDTVIEYDYILVLGSGGCVLEYGRPAELLRTPGGYFASMVADTGETMSKELKQRAEQKESLEAAKATD